jgi:cation diffusion facilitator family transporter
MDRDSLVGHPREVSRVLWITFAMNEAVALLKLVVGYVTGSVGMVSDGFHSMFDGVSNIVGLIGIHIAALPPDKEHPYGHRKYESVFTALVGVMIFGTCFEVLRKAVMALRGGAMPEAGALSFTVMALTIGVNVYVMVYESARGRELESEFLMADAMHTKSNILSSSGVLAGLVLTRLGIPMADAIAALIVATLIARVGYDILKSSADVLVDTVQVDESSVCEAVLSVDGVLDCHDIRSRGSRNHISLDLHIQLLPDTPLDIAHAKTHEVKAAILKAMPEVCDVVLHTEPYRAKGHHDSNKK